MVEFRAKTLRNRFVDSLAASIGALYLAMLSFVLVYSYAGVGVYQHLERLENLAALDKLLALRYFTRSDIIASQRAATERDLPSFFYEAMSESIDDLSENVSEPLPNKKENDGEENKKFEHFIEIPNSRFPKVEIPNAYVRLDVPMRMAVGATCDVLVTQLSPGASFNFATVAIVGARIG